VPVDVDVVDVGAKSTLTVGHLALILYAHDGHTLHELGGGFKNI
jgi:hypothetical protein